MFKLLDKLHPVTIVLQKNVIQIIKQKKIYVQNKAYKTPDYKGYI